MKMHLEVVYAQLGLRDGSTRRTVVEGSIYLYPWFNRITNRNVNTDSLEAHLMVDTH